MTAELAGAHKRMTLLWFSVLSAPLVIGVVLSVMVMVGGYTAPTMLLPEEQLRTLALGAMALMLICSRPLRNFILSPSAIAARPLQGAATDSDANTSAIGKTQASMFMLLGMLDAVSMIVVALSLMQADYQLALLNGAYTLVLAVIAKPDFATLVKATAKELR